MQHNEQKKVWEVPQLQVHGDVEVLTRQAKFLGINDGFTFNGTGQIITNGPPAS